MKYYDLYKLLVILSNNIAKDVDDIANVLHEARMISDEQLKEIIKEFHK